MDTRVLSLASLLACPRQGNFGRWGTWFIRGYFQIGTLRSCRCRFEGYFYRQALAGFDRLVCYTFNRKHRGICARNGGGYREIHRTPICNLERRGLAFLHLYNPIILRGWSHRNNRNTWADPGAA